MGVDSIMANHTYDPPSSVVPDYEKSPVIGRVLLGGSYFLLGGTGFLVSVLVAVALYRAGLLGRGPNGSPIFIVVLCSVMDGIIRNAFYGFYASACVLTQRNLGDGQNSHGPVNELLVYLACGTMNMSQWSELIIAINRLLVIKRVVVDGEIGKGTAEFVFCRTNCLIWALTIFPYEWALGYGFWADVLFGVELPCCK